VTVLLVVGVGVVILGAVILLFIPDRPGGTISWAGAQVSSKGAGLPLIALGVAAIAYSRTGDDAPVPNQTTTEGTVVFSDPFSNPGERRWEDDAEIEGTGGFVESGVYKVRTERVMGYSGVRASPRIAPSGENIRVHVEAHRVGGTATTGFGYGLFCRGEGQANLYRFTVWANHAVIEERRGGRSRILATDAEVTAEAEGDSVKELQAVCTTVDGGNAVELLFHLGNEIPPLKATDTSDPYLSGLAGLHVALPQGGGSIGDTLEVEFDNFEIRGE
jgi:hypothetical protein